MAVHASDAEPDFFAAQGHELNLMPRILRAAFAFLCQNLRIAVSAQAGGNYKNLLCHSFNAPFCSDFCSLNAENLPRQHRAAVRLHDFVDESLDASVAVTMLAAYPMSLPDFKGKKFFNTLFVITMFFNGGLIPTYLLINNIGLLDSMWAVILPGAFSVWNMIIARTYYQGIPRELREAADVDGASEMRYFFNILLPVCMPVVAVLALWQFVAMWNSYFDAMIYLNSASKQPLQLVLRSILIQSQPESGMIADIQSTAERAKMAELLKYATIIISSLPLLVMYPFFQKYFDAGIMAGSVKG